jgi:hypothetical protein
MERQTFLMVGTVEPRKRHAQVLEAFEQLWAAGEDVNLAIVGKVGWNVDPLIQRLRGHPERERRLFWLEGISDEMLTKVYGCATALIVASLGEGFGLPLIEAAQHHLSVIARDIPVFREVAGQHAFYFTGETPEVIARAVNEWRGLHANGGAPSSEGMPWQTWAQSTQQLMNVVLGDNWYRIWQPKPGRFAASSQIVHLNKAAQARQTHDDSGATPTSLPFGFNVAGNTASEKDVGEAIRSGVRALEVEGIPYVINPVTDDS